MSHLPIIARLLTGAAPLLLSIAAMATEPATVASAIATKPKATPSLDLRTPPITETMTQEQIDSVLAKTFEPRNLEEVRVDRSRMRDPDMEDFIPPGFASLFWALGHPSGLWRLFTPMLVQKTPTRIVNPTDPSQPAPGIPAMAGEMRKVDR